MLIHPDIDPIAIHLGPLAIRWYGLTYLMAFGLFIALGRQHLKRRPELGFDKQALEDLLFWGMLGVVIGGRLGEVLFYQPTYYLSHPMQVFAIWQGGMSFHGGFLGVLVACWLWAQRTGRRFWQVTDFIAPLVPTGLAAGRIGNFINGELWGRPASADLPWAMVFPHVDTLPRHPSQLYQVGLEGLLLFVVLWIYSAKPRPLKAVSAAFLLGYGLLRFIAEFFRTPDAGIFGDHVTALGLGLSTAQWLCVPMMLIGGVMLYKLNSTQRNAVASTR